MALIKELADFGQSVWLDSINRKMLNDGTLARLIEQGLRGQTSNPSIFEKAIAGSSEYDELIQSLVRKGKSTFEIYDALTIRDIRDAADFFTPVYEATRGVDGYVSLEINPELSYDSAATVEEGKRLYEAVGRKNLMLKVAATTEGYRSIEELIAAGFNVNATLIFSVEQYEHVAQAYMRGIARFISGGGDPRHVHSVASVFVSRIDSIIDGMLDEHHAHLRGKAAVANASMIYRRYREIFASEDYQTIKQKGASIQRVLWGSTGTKNPDYSDIKYVMELMAKGTVNTIPQETLSAYSDHGAVIEALTEESVCKEDVIPALHSVGIDIDMVCRQLLNDGIIAFEKSFSNLLSVIDEKRRHYENSPRVS